jgi:predicted RND superfamily exporter protein
VILPKSREDAHKIADVLKAEREKQGPASLMNSIQTLDDFLPEEQRQKLEVLQDIRKLLPPRLLARLSHDDQERVTTLLRAERLKPVEERQLPELLLKKFTERNGAVGNLVLVEPPLDSRVTGDGRTITRLIHELRAAADSVAPGTPVAGALPIISDMFEAIQRDGPRATAFALLAVVTLVIFLFRDLATIAQVLLALLLGVTWLAGVILGFRLKINFLNFIALPITFGIGIDYGVNVFQRYREEGSGQITKVIRESGGAVILCSFTTIVGYTSLLIAGNQGFVSFGTLAVAGELTCVTAAVLALPAILIFLQKLRKS